MIQKIAVLVGTSLLLAGCSSLNQPQQPTATPTVQSETVSQVETATDQIAESFSSGQPLQCQVTSSTAGEPPSTYYIKDHKMRMETQATAESLQYFSINDGTTIYVWSSDPAVPAMKMNLEEVKKTAESFDNQFQNFPDLTDDAERQRITDAGSTISCSPATIDDSLFVPPSTITFRDFFEVIGPSVER